MIVLEELCFPSDIRAKVFASVVNDLDVDSLSCGNVSRIVTGDFQGQSNYQHDSWNEDFGFI
jgi:hypothetical protein